MELQVVWNGDVHAPGRGYLCTEPDRPRRPDPKVDRPSMGPIPGPLTNLILVELLTGPRNVEELATALHAPIKRIRVRVNALLMAGQIRSLPRRSLRGMWGSAGRPLVHYALREVSGDE